MRFNADVIVDGEYILLPEEACEDLRIELKTPFGRLSDGAVIPKSMAETLAKIRAAGWSIGYRRPATPTQETK